MKANMDIKTIKLGNTDVEITPIGVGTWAWGDRLFWSYGKTHTNSQVALNWLICKGGVPIPGAKNAHQARENAGALGWRLTSEEVAALDVASAEVG
jgi:aryl-alcohol dehydrogenase-like predicted oxidoreductase